MIDTSGSLLQRLAGSSDPQAWTEFVETYTPLLRSWLSRYGVQSTDVDDLAQETLLALVADIRRFQHPGHAGAFRGWLRSILVNRLRAFWRRQQRLPGTLDSEDLRRRIDELEDPHSRLSDQWNREHDRCVLESLLARLEGHFEARTFQIFRRYVLEGLPASQVAQEFQVSINAVCIAKSRVLRALREEVASGWGWLEFDPW